MIYLAFLLTGLFAGVCSGLFGVGGGVVIVPILIFLFGFNQTAANATSLAALLLPVGALGFWQYYRVGKIDNSHLWSGLIIAIGIFLGALFGAKLAIDMDTLLLRRLFAGFLVLIAVRLWFV